MEKELTGDRKFTVNVSSEGQCKRVLDIEIPEEELERERGLIKQELRRDLRVPGFRKGKVPVSYIEKNYGEVIRGDAVRNLLPVVYEQAVRQEHLHPLGEPHFHDLAAEPGEGIKVRIHVEVRPEIEIEGYHSIAVEATRKEVSDEQVQEALQGLRERLASYQPVERAAESTDLVTIDYAPYLESGEIDEKARQKNHPVEMESSNLLEEFRLGLVGMKSGDERDIEVDYPADFPEKSLAGRKRRFHVRMTEVKEKLVPDLDDAFAKRLGDKFETLDALRAQIRKDLEEEEDKRYRHEIQEKAIDRLIERNPFEVPEVMVQNYLASVLDEDRRRRPGVEDEAAREKEVQELFRDAAVRSIRKYFILEAIRRQEAIEVTEEEVGERVQRLAEATGREEQEIRDYLRDPEHRRSLEGEMLDEKVLEYLREQVDVRAA
jgi:trigger factor